MAEKNAEIWTQLICLQSHHSNNVQAAGAFEEQKKTRERKKPLKLKKPDSITASSSVDLYVHLCDNNQVVVSYAEEIWWNFAHPLLIDALKNKTENCQNYFSLFDNASN